MRFIAVIGCLALLAGGVATPVRGTQRPGSPASSVAGSYTYRTYCATCHGEKGKGDGPLAESLRFVPPDLTQMAQRNGGRFPRETVRKIVDGREPIDGHGGPDMPVWGDAFSNAETGFDDEKVRLKIEAVVDHLETLQGE
jgi:mono/diheme cytochrome c family protein